MLGENVPPAADRSDSRAVGQPLETLVTLVRAPASLPRHMHLDLSQDVMRNVSGFRLRAHTH
eukprot:1002537-Pelagomonas_calceolata.AAC.1